jgi:hypothetical protein
MEEQTSENDGWQQGTASPSSHFSLAARGVSQGYALLCTHRTVLASTHG